MQLLCEALDEFVDLWAGALAMPREQLCRKVVAFMTACQCRPKCPAILEAVKPVDEDR